jgi:hypothetical protein
MKLSVEGMKKERKHVFVSFGLGLISLQCAALSFSWAHVQDDRYSIPTLVSLVLLGSMALTVKIAVRIYGRFMIPETEYIDGYVPDENVWQDQLVHAWVTRATHSDSIDEDTRNRDSLGGGGSIAG